MADKSLSSLVGGDLGLGVVSQASGVIASGVTGGILTINAPNENSIINLYLLVCPGANTQAGITLIADGNTIKSEALLDDNAAADGNAFRVQRSYATDSAGSPSVGVLYEVRGKQIVVNKNAGNTTSNINYAYEILGPIS